MRIFIDLDDVLADFRTAASLIHGRSREEVDQLTIEKGVWDICEAIGITQDAFWKPIHEAGSRFWEKLSPLPWAQELLDLVRSKTDDWYVLTAPSRCPSSLYGKGLWCQQFFGPEAHRMIPTRHKHLLATSVDDDCILIDDRETGIQRFIAAGGDGILFPSVSNQLRYLRDNPLKYLRSQLL